jgi:glycosyltransferase involved in cell wall biosynthesis
MTQPPLVPRSEGNRSLSSAFRSRFPDVAHGAGEYDLVSVVIPVCNRGDLLRRALASVASQTWRPIEAIVVDDGSEEDIGTVVAEFNGVARMIRQANSGVTAARNRGLQEARGEFIAFLDSDDWWEPSKISAQVALLRARPDAVMVWTDMRAVNEAGAVRAPRFLRTYYDSSYKRLDIERVLPIVGQLGAFAPGCPEEIRDAVVRIGNIFADMLYGNLVHTSTVLVRRTRLVAGGGFDPTLARTGEDYEFHWRTSFFGPVVLIEEPMVSYRIGASDQLSSAEWAYARGRNALTTVTYWLEAAGPAMKQSPGDVRRRLAELERSCGERRVLLGENGGIPHLVVSLRHDPLEVRSWALLFVAIWPRSLRNMLLSTWRLRPVWARRRR